MPQAGGASQGTECSHRHDSGLRVNWHDPLALAGTASSDLARQWATESMGITAGTGSDIGIVWLDSGHRVTRHQVILAQQRAPRHLTRQWAPSHQARQWALSQLARQRAPGHQVPDCLARQRASSLLP
ncbi:unnamed protein product, partial [Staurois parvus]